METCNRPALYFEAVRKSHYQEHILSKYIENLRSTGHDIAKLVIFEQKINRAEVLQKVIRATGRPQEKFTLQDNINHLRLSAKLIKELLESSIKFEYTHEKKVKVFQLDLRFKIYITELFMTEFSRDD